MIYPYHCDTCNIDFDVVKLVEHYQREECCDKCNQIAWRRFTTERPLIDKIDRYRCPALQTDIYSRAQRKEVAKQKNLIELGNENISKIETKMTEERQQRSEKSYDEALRKVFG